MLSPFGLYWSVKYLNFWQKLPIRTTYDTFLESRHPEVTKNPHYVFPPSGARKRYQLMYYKDAKGNILMHHNIFHTKIRLEL